jgi:Na+-transporting methylmalonyl-CoA/oxaloacetate decarboxylase gamma subunit
MAERDRIGGIAPRAADPVPWLLAITVMVLGVAVFLAALFLVALYIYAVVTGKLPELRHLPEEAVRELDHVARVVYHFARDGHLPEFISSE